LILLRKLWFQTGFRRLRLKPELTITLAVFAMADDPIEGHLEGHTLGAGAENPLAAAVSAYASASSDDLFDLLKGSVEHGAQDTLARAASGMGAKPGPGRPLGSKMRRNVDLADYLAAHGHRDPAYTLSLIQTIDPVVLAGLMREHGKQFVRALDRIIKAATALVPYVQARKTPEIVLPAPMQRPLMVIGQMNVQQISSDGALSAGLIMDKDGERSTIPSA
jgi:hypothetical protein